MPATAARHEVGSLVRVRGREWVVTRQEGELLHLQPLSGGEAEAVAVHLGLEADDIAPAHFPPPRATDGGDLLAGRLLRDAARLALRDGAAPFRSLGRLSVRPRPYQFVPLIMALRLAPARLLIADDVGIGKTVEAGLIAAELMARGATRRLLVLCPPHLCDQWEEELREKFHLAAHVVRSGTLARLERAAPPGRSLYEYFPHLIVSLDFAKMERHRPLLLEHCPDLVIVDEAHTAASPGHAPAQAGLQQRHDLVRAVAEDPARQLLLLTATPHSGIPGSFQSLLTLLHPDFAAYDLEALNEGQRRNLARHVVQRRRGDLDERWLGASAGQRPFPRRVGPFEDTYAMASADLALFQDVLGFIRAAVRAPAGSAASDRARGWAALALLRCLMSSPAAAAAALRNRAELAAVAPADDEAAAAERWQREVLDASEDATPDAGESDLEPSCSDELAPAGRAQLQQFCRRAEALAQSGADPKLAKAAEILAQWLEQGRRPIVFCRYIATAKYLEAQLPPRLAQRFAQLSVAAVSGETGSEEERRAAIDRLTDPETGGSRHRILVATDCLSEGINLQQHFDSVLHYDLPWNPNRLEQREGRVDRFGQPQAEVKALVLFSPDNPVDGLVLRVLIRKAREIYKTLGTSLPVPGGSESAIKAVMRAVLADAGAGDAPRQLSLLPELDAVKLLHERWERNAEREKASRSRFAQHAIRPEEVARELAAADSVLGDPDAVRTFLLNAGQRFGLPLQPRGDHWLLDAARLEPEMRQRLGWKPAPVRVLFQGPPPLHLEGAAVLGRNHPLVAGLSQRVLGRAFAPRRELDRARVGAAYTAAVATRTVLALLRLRFRLLQHGRAERFAEEVVVASRSGGADSGWRLAPAGLLAAAEAAANISELERAQRIGEALQAIEASAPALAAVAQERAGELEATYARLQGSLGGAAIAVRAWPPDLLGAYVLLPGGGA